MFANSQKYDNPQDLRKLRRHVTAIFVTSLSVNRVLLNHKKKTSQNTQYLNVCRVATDQTDIFKSLLITLLVGY